MFLLFSAVSLQWCSPRMWPERLFLSFKSQLKYHFLREDSPLVQSLKCPPPLYSPHLNANFWKTVFKTLACCSLEISMLLIYGYWQRTKHFWVRNKGCYLFWSSKYMEFHHHSPPPRQIPSMGSKKRSTGKWYTCCGFTLHIRYNQYGESIGFMVSHKQACPLYVANKTLGNGWMSSS